MVRTNGCNGLPLWRHWNLALRSGRPTRICELKFSPRNVHYAPEGRGRTRGEVQLRRVSGRVTGRRASRPRSRSRSPGGGVRKRTALQARGTWAQHNEGGYVTGRTGPRMRLTVSGCPSRRSSPVSGVGSEMALAHARSSRRIIHDDGDRTLGQQSGLRTVRSLGWAAVRLTGDGRRMGRSQRRGPRVRESEVR